MTIHVYAGPSLAGSPVLALNGIGPHPPVAHGDLYRLRLAPGDAVLIVDGVYQHIAAIRHREILALYASGVPVYGAASLGALRACELLGHGMTGLGTVFGWYRDGRVSSDADVALTHGDADIGFRAFTYALVSVLSVTDRMVSAGTIGQPTASMIVELARSVHFGMRTRAALLAVASAAGLSAAMERVLDELGPERLGDIKRMDAEAAVRDLLARPALTPPRDAVRVPDTSYGREWRLQHIPATADAAGPTQGQVLTYAQLFLPDFPAWHTQYVLDHLRPEYPAVGAGGRTPHWLAGLSTEDLVRRSLLTPHELSALSAEERATRILVRSFRLRSGRLVYDSVPAGLRPEMAELAVQCARLLRLNEQVTRVNPAFHPGDVPSPLLDSAFAALWGTDEVATHALDRGFRTVEAFREQARPFFLGARAAVKLAAAV